MIEIRHPGLLAHLIELDLIRFQHVEGVFRIPPVLADHAEALERVAAMLREAEGRGQPVDLADEVMRLIQAFRLALRTAGGANAEA
jgi:hypothetical protein